MADRDTDFSGGLLQALGAQGLSLPPGAGILQNIADRTAPLSPAAGPPSYGAGWGAPSLAPWQSQPINPLPFPVGPGVTGGMMAALPLPATNIADPSQAQDIQPPQAAYTPGWAVPALTTAPNAYVPGFSPDMPPNLADPGAGAAEPKAWSSDDGHTVYILRPNNTLEVKTGDSEQGTLAWRNNNFGNIRHDPGAIGTNQSHFGPLAIFDSPAAGADAQQNLLFGPKYADKTITDAIQAYAPKPQNDPQAYIADVMRRTGMNPDTVLNTMSPAQRQAFMDAIRHHEGLTTGNSTLYSFPYGY